MKNVIQSILVLVIMSTTAFAQKANDLEKISIKTSAQCEMCKQTIEKAMAYEKGVKTFNLDVATATLTVEYVAKKTSAEKIREAVSKVGYDADDVPADEKAYNNLPDCCKKGGH
ncbi:MAG: heavy-metal-associated domain-containing protein [Flavobacteriales bacterium]|nr:heavy-metal-associated domain-containing protein [Flavobacteriales bacterium]